MRDSSIKNLVYRAVESDVRGHKIVEVSYRRNDDLVKRQLMMQDHSEEDLPNEAKRIIDYEDNNRSLTRYSHSYSTVFHRFLKGLIITIVSVGALVALGFALKILYDHLAPSLFPPREECVIIRCNQHSNIDNNSNLNIELYIK